MARHPAVSTIASILHKLRVEWHSVVSRLGEINATFADLGIPHEPPHRSGRRPGRPQGSTGKAGRRRKRGTFAQTADEFVLGLLKGKKMTSREVNRAWKAAGRAGVSNSTLTKLAKAKKLVRRKTKGERGGTYSAA
ncbi:MAG: hypothetical protein K8S99_17775 [Planctomycetes bacterium]|nr:hypothetical protein [Planctomycetota bacterium]